MKWALGFFLALPAWAASPPGPQSPIAVMPFKNLNADPAMEWLRAGMAETMVSDLKRTGKVTVVERAQIDKALAEIQLTASGQTEESTAARVGKMTGANTVVVGSFQEAAKQLRINARFVAVETGEVIDAAKSTGPLTHVFALQDEIVGRLVGGEPGAKPRGRAPRRSGEKTLKAYKLYAMAMTTANDADRVGYLQESLQADPEFSYSQDELDALRGRLKAFEEKTDQRLSDEAARAKATLEDPGLSPTDRMMKATRLMADLMSSQRYADLKSVCLRMQSMDLPPANGIDLKELAHYYLFMAEEALNERDLALKTGDEFLQRYPRSMYAQGVQMRMKAALDQRQSEAEATQEGAKDLEPELARIRREYEHDRAEAASVPEKLVMLDATYAFAQCSTLASHHAAQRAIDACEAFGKRGSARLPKEMKDLPPTARFLAAQQHAALREFKAAREILSELERSDPTYAKRMNFEAFRTLWRTE